MKNFYQRRLVFSALEPHLRKLLGGRCIISSDGGGEVALVGPWVASLTQPGPARRLNQMALSQVQVPAVHACDYCPLF